MNFEEIKTEWARINKTLANTQELNEHLVAGIIKERSRSRVAKIRRTDTIYLVLMFVNLGLLIAIFAGNPFDFRYAIQFVPYGLLAFAILLAIASLFKSLQTLNTNLSAANLDSFLRKAIDAYTKNNQVQKWFGIFIFSSGTLTALSFLPKKLEHKELWWAIGETALMMIITIVIYFIAFKAGAFKNNRKEDFEDDLEEWNRLKNISAGLKNK
ncbi:MAG: hypothetical protein ABI594_05560 [Ginsengibacter sp.]